MAELFGKAYCISTTVEKAVKGFETTGIWPFDDNKFIDEDFAASMMTDEPMPASHGVTAAEVANEPAAESEPTASTSYSAAGEQSQVTHTLLPVSSTSTTEVSAAGGFANTDVSTTTTAAPVPSSSQSGI